jgi:hypothetical protein
MDSRRGGKKRDFSPLQKFQTGYGAHPRESFPGTQWLGRGGDHSLPSNTEVRMCGAHASAPYMPSRRAKGQIYRRSFITHRSVLIERTRIKISAQRSTNLPVPCSGFLGLHEHKP